MDNISVRDWVTALIAITSAFLVWRSHQMAKVVQEQMDQEYEPSLVCALYFDFITNIWRHSFHNLGQHPVYITGVSLQFKGEYIDETMGLTVASGELNTPACTVTMEINRALKEDIVAGGEQFGMEVYFLYGSTGRLLHTFEYIIHHRQGRIESNEFVEHRVDYANQNISRMFT